MRLCYQVATPDVAIADSVTAYQGPIEKSFADLAKIGYDGVELMSLAPMSLDWQHIKDEAEKNGLKIVLICTGEIWGQLGLSFGDPDAKVRADAIAHVKEDIDFAAFMGADINIGRVRGHYCKEISKEQTEAYVAECIQELADYAAAKNVRIALETVTLMQTNYINTCADAVRLINQVNRPNFRLMIDVFHLNLEEKNLIEAIKEYSPYNIHVHFADNNRRWPGNCGMDYPTIIKTFKECGFDENFSCEFFQIPDQEFCAKACYDYLAPIFKEVYGRDY